MGSAFEGGGLAVGPAYRARFGDTGALDAHAAWSAANYRVLDARLRLPEMADGRVVVQLSGNWLDAPRVAFYGVGNDSPADRRNYAYRIATAGASARLQASRFVAFGAGLEGVAIDSSDASPTFRRSRLFAEFDSRPSQSYARHGGLYRVDWANYEDLRTGGRNSFRRIDAEAQRFVPVLRENWVIALRGSVSSTDASAGQEVPYFLMPALGGSHTLRGYPTWRFRDRHRMVLTGEYRWTAGQFVDMALFVDAGKVTDRARDLNLRGLKTPYGIGLTFHTPRRTIARIELARSREGMGLAFSFSPSF
jgi:outer membrane protein assembly factor BamA